MDRLGQRVQVQRVAANASHWPERAATALDAHGTPPAMPTGWAGRSPPVLLLRRPLPLAAAASLPDALPASLHWGGTLHRLRQAEGPARLEPEWWRDRHGQPRRDYYRVELSSGVRLWIYRAGAEDAPHWLLHGFLP